MFALQRRPSDEPQLAEFIQVRLDRLDILDPGPREQFPVPRLDRPSWYDSAARAHVECVINLFARAREETQGQRRMLKAVRSLIKIPFWRNRTRIGLGLG